MQTFSHRRIWIFAAAALLLVAAGAGTLLSLRNGKTDEAAGAIEKSVTAVPERQVALSAPAENTEPAASHERPPEREGVDAANLYKNAFALWDQLTKEEQQMLMQANEEVDAQAAGELFKKIQPIMALLHEAAKADYCDWALGDFSWDTGLPHISKAQQLTKLALWNAAYRMPTDPDGAVADLVARAHLGHHLADTLIGYLVGGAIEAGAITLLRQHASVLTPSASQTAHQMLAASFLEQDIGRVFQGEAAIPRSFLNLSEEERVRRFSAFESGDANLAPEDAAKARALERLIRDRASLELEVEYITRTYEELAQVMQGPRAEFDAWWKAVELELPNHPLAAFTMPSVVATRGAVDRSRTNRSMLLAGLAVLQHGPSQLAQHRDPYTSQPFIYVQKGSWFELRSTLQHRGKPLQMEFLALPQ